MKKLNTRQIALNGIVAGLYAAITILTASFAYGNIQFRISEALMMLLLFEPHLTIGLTIGCLIANLFSTVSVLDIVIAQPQRCWPACSQRASKSRGSRRCPRFWSTP